MDKFTLSIIKVLPQHKFDDEMRDRGLVDSNVEEVKDEAFISIIGTKECNENYLEEPDTKHWFESDHANVLNLEFDDVEEDTLYRGCMFRAITNEQAEKLVRFIDANKGKNFTIHCRAGISRSQAVGCFIYDTGKEYYSERQPYLMREFANKGVRKKLMFCYVALLADSEDND